MTAAWLGPLLLLVGLCASGCGDWTVAFVEDFEVEAEVARIEDTLGELESLELESWRDSWSADRQVRGRHGEVPFRLTLDRGEGHVVLGVSVEGGLPALESVKERVLAALDDAGIAHRRAERDRQP